MNNEFDLSSLLSTKKDLLLSTDAFGVCTGVFAIRNCSWSKTFLDSLWTLGSLDPSFHKDFDGRDTWEQNSVKVLLKYFPSVRQHCDLISEDIIQNRLSPFNQKAWIFHLWMNGRSTREFLNMRKAVRRLGWTKSVRDNSIPFAPQKWRVFIALAKQIQISEASLFYLIGGIGNYKQCPPESELPFEQSILLVRISDVANLALHAFKDKQIASNWLLAKHKTFLGQKPIEHINTTIGFSRVVKQLKYSNLKSLI